MKAKIDTVAIYRARNAVRGTLAQSGLPEPRSEECRQGCMAADSSSPELCDLASCWAHRVSGRMGPQPRQRLQVERGRTLAPRPRSLAQIARDCYGAGSTDESRIIQTSGRGGRP